MNPPKSNYDSVDFMRLRINRSYEAQIKEIGRILNHQTPSQTVEYILSRTIDGEVAAVRKLLKGNDQDT